MQSVRTEAALSLVKHNNNPAEAVFSLGNVQSVRTEAAFALGKPTLCRPSGLNRRRQWNACAPFCLLCGRSRRSSLDEINLTDLLISPPPSLSARRFNVDWMTAAKKRNRHPCRQLATLKRARRTITQPEDGDVCQVNIV